MTEEQLTFLSAIVPPALECEAATGIPAAITVAQAILESAGRDAEGAWHWGYSPLYREAHNPFGIKFTSFSAANGACGFYNSQTTECNTAGISYGTEAEFAYFATLADAFQCHAALFTKIPRYGAAAALLKGASGNLQEAAPGKPRPDAVWPVDPATFAIAISRAGYSTNPKYAGELMLIVHECHLCDRAVLTSYGKAAAGGLAFDGSAGLNPRPVT